MLRGGSECGARDILFVARKALREGMSVLPSIDGRLLRLVPDITAQ